MPSSGVQTCARSEEHTSELQSHSHLVCRLLLEKKKYETAVLVPDMSSRFRLRPAGTDALGVVIDCSQNVKQLRLHSGRNGLFAFFFFFNDTATPEIYTLSLHDALPINDTATTEIYTLSLHDVFRSRWSPYHLRSSCSAGLRSVVPALNPRGAVSHRPLPETMS